MLVNDVPLEDLENIEALANQWWWGFVISCILTIAFTCCFCCYREDLNTAIDVIDASMDFLADT